MKKNIRKKMSRKKTSKNQSKPLNRSLILLAVAFLFLIVIIITTPIIKQEIDINLYPKKYENLVEKYSSENNLSQSFVYAVIFSESGFDPEAISEDNAIGLMQVTEETFDWIKFKMNDSKEEKTVFNDLYDPETNIKYGTFLLNLHISEFGTEKNALAAYHAGRGQLQKWLKNKEYSTDGKNITSVPFKKTNFYIHKVLDVSEKYTKLYFSE